MSVRSKKSLSNPKGPALTSPAALAEALGVELKPTLKPNQMQRLRRALPGYAGLLDDVAELLERDGDGLGFGDVRPDELLDLQRRYKDLRASETLLETVYLSVYHQRLQVDDVAMGLLQRIVRRVQSRMEEDPQMPLRWGILLDFMGAFRKGGRAPAPVEPPAPPAPPAGEAGSQ